MKEYKLDKCEHILISRETVSGINITYSGCPYKKDLDEEKNIMIVPSCIELDYLDGELSIVKCRFAKTIDIVKKIVVCNYKHNN